MVVGSLRVVRLHRTAVVIAEIAIVNCSMVCVDCASRGLLPLVGQILKAVGQQVLHQFVQEGVDGSQYIAAALGLFIA